ncbi:MAG: glycogen synthase GlgA [Oscillospiraceae bacterium]|nr:glycogen synthase GlgA [Oscillospiraceae bacterium]
MKIVFTASEAAPFIKTGGLGDVAEALPRALSEQKGNEVLLFLPYYKRIKENPDIKTEFVKSFAVELSWRRQHVGIFKLKSNKRKLKVYFIDNEYYFGRDGVYGYPDDGERFAYYSKAVLEALCQLNEKPDVIHCNDWQTALIPLILHAFYEKSLGEAKTVFTIHNIEYQGKADPYFIGDVIGLSHKKYNNTLIFDGCVNFMKSAILCCDALTTVSETYAQEIKYPYYAHGLAGVISDHDFKLSGIVNGINTGIFDPESDRALLQNYTKKTAAEGKAANKAALQQKLSLEVREDVPVIGMVSRLVSHKGVDLICAAIDELMRWDVQIVIVGTGDSVYEERLRRCAEKNPKKFSLNLCFDPALASQIYAASDIYLMPSKSEPCGLSQIIAMRYGTIPVVNQTGGLKDTVAPYNPESGKGVGFTFQSFERDDMLSALRRALHIYGADKAGWSRLINNAMSRESSWKAPAEKYTELYKKLMSH